VANGQKNNPVLAAVLLT